ncbi:hypothetical protein BGZ93_003083 [Podila epicladia]|nr:hypothetical protein BGZ92_005779 [Podila epicladia]KAG0097269.1 hypothetical protein BGZ93_003083 [Podila epicladia]
MSTHEDSEQSSKMRDLAGDMDRQATLSETASINKGTGPSTSDMTTISTGSDKEDHRNAAPGSPNSVAFGDSYHNTTDGENDVPILSRRKSSLMPAGSRLRRAASAEKHVTIIDGGDTTSTTEATDSTASKDEAESSAKDEETSKQELANILHQFDPLVESKEKNASSSSGPEDKGSTSPSNDGGLVPFSPDISLSSESSPRTPQLDSPQTSHDVKLAMSEKASKSKKKSENRQKSALNPETPGSKSSGKGTVSSNISEPKPKEIPFDFHKFLEQMRHRSAMPITRYFQSFLKEFDKKPWTVNEQIKIIHDFLDFITGKMEICELWKNATDQEFENVKEGMEKLVMNRLFTYTFSPSTTDDAERDEVLNQKIRIFRWIREEHLDIPHSPHNEAYLNNAQSELKKINSYKAPRDKVICILNCCKFIFTLIRRSEGNSKGADTFLPILIYVVLRSNPPNLVSNVQYISRFRNPEKLQAEAGYYLASLMGAISFVENLEASSLSISLEEFDQQIEKTMTELSQEKSEALAAAEIAAAAATPTPEQSGQVLLKKQESKLATLLAGTSTRSSRQRSTMSPSMNEKQGLSPDPQSRNQQQFGSMSEKPVHASRGGSESSSNLNYSRISPSPSSVIINPAAALIERGANFATKTMQKPLDLIERIFQDNGDDGEMAKPYPPRSGQNLQQQQQIVYPDGPPPQLPQRPTHQNNRQDSFQEFVYVPTGGTLQQPSPIQPTFHQQRQLAIMQQYPGNLSEVPPNSEHTRQRTISGGQLQAPRQHQRQQTTEEYLQALETLTDMFPSCERQVCDVILQANDGRLSPSIDTLLEISSANEKTQQESPTSQNQQQPQEELLISFSPPTQSSPAIEEPSEHENTGSHEKIDLK